MVAVRDRRSSPARQAERAKSNLRACAVVGLTERFDETILLLKKAYGWRMPFYERRNVGKHRLSPATIPAEVVHQIATDNSLDVALYTYAQELFAEQVRQYGPTLRRDVQIFRALNQIWQRRQQTQKWTHETATTINQRLIDPAYAALTQWGGLRRLVPARFTPRVVAAVENNGLYLDLWMGQHRVGNYDPQKQRWDIQRPFHLLVDERALPGTSNNLQTKPIEK